MRITVKVKPRSRTISIKEVEGILEVSLRSIPDKGVANSELLRVLSEHFQVPITSITIVRGNRSRHKIIEIVE